MLKLHKHKVREMLYLASNKRLFKDRSIIENNNLSSLFFYENKHFYVLIGITSALDRASKQISIY